MKEAECPICHGTGRIGTSDWLTKHLSAKQLAEGKAKAIAEHEQHIKTEVAREIFEEIEDKLLPKNTSGEFRGDSIEWFDYFDLHLAEDIAELKKKYTEGGDG